MSRHVRITLEGVATCDEGGQILRTRMGGADGPLVLISQAWPGVTVEDVTPPRTWTDGDVLASNRRAYHRHEGRWWPTRPIANAHDGYSDSDMEAMLEYSSSAVLRYQAGE